MSPRYEGYHKDSSFLKVLQSRELGFCHAKIKPFVKEPLIKLLIRTRWCFSQSSTLKKDYKMLLGGDFSLCEYRFTHLLCLEMKRVAQECCPVDEKPGNLLVEQLKKSKFVRLSLAELLELVVKQGFNLGMTHADDVRLITESHHSPERREELLRLLISYSIERKDMFLFTTTFTMVLQVILRSPDLEWFERDLQLLHWMFTSGLTIPYESCRDWISSAFQDFHRCRQYDLTIRMLMFFIEKAIEINGAFQNFCSYKVIHRCLMFPELYATFFSFARVFIENYTTLPAVHTKEQSSVSEVFKSSVKKSQSPDMTVLVESCIENNLHLVIEDDDDGLNMLLIMCRSYNGRDLPRIVNLLCQAKLNVNCHDYYGNNALIILAEREDKTSQEVRESVNILISYGINVNETNMDGLNPLQSFVLHKTPFCCNFKLLSHWREWKFWNVLNALLNNGCRVEPLIYDGSSLLLNLLKLAVTRVCDNCSPSANSLCFSQVFTPALNFLERLLQTGLSILAVLNIRQKECIRESVLFYIVANYKGEDLLHLVELFCKYGADVNVTTTSKINSNGTYRRPMNLVQILKRENLSELQLVNRVHEILLTHGFNH